MKTAAFVLFVWIVAVAQAAPNQRTQTNEEDRVFVNFIKFLSAFLISEPKPPPEVQSAVKVLMKQLLNAEPFSHMSLITKSMLRVYSSNLKVQILNMLNLIRNSETETIVANASGQLYEYLESRQAKMNFAEIGSYVKSLYQPINTLPMNEDFDSSNALAALILPARRPASN